MNQKLSTAVKIGRYLLYQRQKRDWTITDFAQKTGLTASFIFRLEQGEYKTIKLDALEKIADGLDMTMTDFINKCQLDDESSRTLPTIEFALKERFHFPQQAIEEIMLFIEFLAERYQKEITSQKQQSAKYWRGKGKGRQTKQPVPSDESSAVSPAATD